MTKGTNDVIVGPGLKPGKYDCSTVDAAPSSATAQFGEIIVKSGGLLTVPAGATGLNPLKVADICLESGSQFIVGSPGTPQTAQSKFTIIFTGNKSDAGSSDPVCQKGGLDGNQHFKKGIDVTKGATLELYGAKGVPSSGGVSWTTLAKPAGPMTAGAAVASTGADKLILTADVTQGTAPWQAGDWIVVATTNFVPFDTEFVQINAVSKDTQTGGSVVKLSQPLQYYHFGSLAPSSASATCPDPLDTSKTQPKFLCDGADRNYGVDERAEVGLISRDILLTADTAPITPAPPATTTSEHWGGEIMIHQGFTKVSIQGVRLSKFGKDQLGSYPIHFHMVGDAQNKPLIDADSVDHSYNKCVTLHDMANLTVSNMVCARIVGHIFYQELDNPTNTDDSGITFKNDLGLGAMSNSFDIYGVNVLPLPPGHPPGSIPPGNHTRAYMIDHYWWTGDYMTNNASSPDYINYDGFNIPDTDNQSQTTHGSCYTANSNGQWINASAPPCSSGSYYIEPASGFWIQNPATTLIGNAIGGCQGVGNGFWWVPPVTPITVSGTSVNLTYQPIGMFENNRAHACYQGFYGDSSIGGVLAGTLTPQVEKNGAFPSVIATFDEVTATRNRFRGLWIRGSWFVVKDGHFASNRDNISLLTSGGIDGNPPGAWDLLEDSALVGLSENNPGRWGPCPYATPVTGAQLGGPFGCIDYTPSSSAHSGDIYDNGYQDPHWNSAGYYLYDGPIRVFHNRFVNFNYNAGWTKDMPCSTSSTPSPGAFYRELDHADCSFLKSYENFEQNPELKGPPAPYEGDAAFGWFLANQNTYPTGTASKQLMFVNTNLRHQVFTEQVNIGNNFVDGDKNTSVIDEDGTLDGFGIKLAPNSGTNPVHPISLNNLPFNGTSNAVDECLSRGAQNEQYEGRTSALMSPASMGTLQFSSLPGGATSYFQQVTFSRDDLVPKAPPPSTAMFHPAIAMRYGRNGLGSFEPKVSNGYGYTVAVAPTTAPGIPHTGKAGVAKWVDVTLADIVDPNISTAHPFYIRLGIDYASIQNGEVKIPAGNFTVKRGYKSYYGGGVNVGDPQLQMYWTNLNCNNLDAVNTSNLPTDVGGMGYCPAASGSTSAPIPVSTLSRATSITELTNSNGTPNLHKYYYNSTTGYLYLNIVQQTHNPIGPSPTGSCDSYYVGSNPDPACPDWQAKNPESYYACPQNGCIDYTITMNDSSYTPGPSPTTSRWLPAAANLKPAPAHPNKLVVIYGSNPGTVVAPVLATDDQGVPYYTASTDTASACPVTQPPPP
ncbi:MAG: G8 domain-containing protein [Gammaproteobacteria bacterium]